MSSFNFKGPEQQKLVGSLSGGERNRVHLAKLLASGGNVLLLDEPTNDLDVDTLRALEDALESFAGCVVVISHDRWFLDRLATHILAFEGDSPRRVVRGQLRGLREGPPPPARRRGRPAPPHQVPAHRRVGAIPPSLQLPASATEGVLPLARSFLDRLANRMLALEGDRYVE